MQEPLASALLSELSSRQSPSKRISLPKEMAVGWHEAARKGCMPVDYKLDYHTRDGSRIIGAWPKDIESLGAGLGRLHPRRSAGLTEVIAHRVD